MKKTILGAILWAMTGAAAAQEGVLQLFACNLSEGKTFENVWQTLEMLGDNAGEAAAQDPGFGLFLWLPYRGSSDYDYIWGVTNTDLNTMAAGSAGYFESGTAALMQPRFADLGRCDSSISMTEQIRTGVVGTGEDRQPDALVETFGCQLKGGAGMDDIKKAVTFWQEQMDDIETPGNDSYDAYLLTPLRGMRAGIDFGWIGTYPDIGAFAQGTIDYNTSKGGQAADERFDKVSSCQSNLWAGFWIETPQNRM